MISLWNFFGIFFWLFTYIWNKHYLLLNLYVPADSVPSFVQNLQICDNNILHHGLSMFWGI